MSRVALSKIRSLTLYRGELTASRRVPPVPQLKCVGKACELFQPEAVRCHNNGGIGTDIDWTCEADLPEKLRFGRVEVSCEGWDAPGDPYVLKGSCGLEYHLVNMSDSPKSTFSKNISWNDFLHSAFIWLTILIALYLFFKPYIWRFLGWFKRHLSWGPSRPASSRPSEFYSSSGGGRRPPPPPPHYPPPPPYAEYPKPDTSSSSWWGRDSSSSSSSSGSGFWTGLGLGSLGGLAAARAFGGGSTAPPPAPPLRPTWSGPEYDWERERRGRGVTSGWFGSPWSWSSPGSPYSTTSRTRVIRTPSDNDRGEGPSNLGSTRRSTGYGVTNVR